MSTVNLMKEPEIAGEVSTAISEIFRPWELPGYLDEPEENWEWEVIYCEFTSILDDLRHGDHTLEKRARELANLFEELHESEINEAMVLGTYWDDDYDYEPWAYIYLDDWDDYDDYWDDLYDDPWDVWSDFDYCWDEDLDEDLDDIIRLGLIDEPDHIYDFDEYPGNVHIPSDEEKDCYDMEILNQKARYMEESNAKDRARKEEDFSLAC